MPPSVKMILLVILGVAALWDGFTTVYGTAKIFGVKIVFATELPQTQDVPSIPAHAEPTGEHKFFVLFASMLFGALILALIIASGMIFTGPNLWLKCLSSLAIAYDLLTSFIGNLDVIYYGHVVGWLGWLVLLGFTLFVSGSSVVLALLSKRARLQVFSKLII
jgi:hypothetical protein